MLLRKGHVAQDIGFGIVHKWPVLGASDASGQRQNALLADHLGRSLREGGGNEGRSDAPAAIAGMGERIAHGVDAATLHVAHNSLDTVALMPT